MTVKAKQWLFDREWGFFWEGTECMWDLTSFPNQLSIAVFVVLSCWNSVSLSFLNSLITFTSSMAGGR